MEECAICLSSLNDTTKPVRLLNECGHAFHILCIDRWNEIHSNCPLCRRNLYVRSDFETLAKEINTMSGFRIRYERNKSNHNNNNNLYHKLEIIKHMLLEYKTIRNNGYSADHLASDIGYLVSDINDDLLLTTTTTIRSRAP